MVKVLCFMVLLMVQGVFSNAIFSIGGSVLSGGSLMRQSRVKSVSPMQFDSAANIMFGVQMLDNVSTTFDFGIGQQNGSGFEESIALQRFKIVYLPKDYKMLRFSLGSLIIPFGQFSDSQTYNSRLSSPFLVNDLGYTFLTNPYNNLDEDEYNHDRKIKNFGGSGFLTSIKLDKEHGDIDVFVFNHTGDYFQNDDGGFGIALRFKNRSFVENTTLSASLFSLNDMGVPKAINAETNAIIFDVKTIVNVNKLVSDIELGGYYMFINLNDGKSNTKDSVSSYMGYVTKRFDQFTLGVRWSYFSPTDHNGQEPVNSGLSSPSFIIDSALPGDVDVDRFQFSGILHLEKGVNWHNEFVFDRYFLNNNHESNTGLFSYFSLAF
jgi:hypothetical protein